SKCASVEGILVDRIHVPDNNPKSFISRASDGLRDISHLRPQEHFPWNRLPLELRVKILQILSKSDLDKCRFLNRDTFELIRCNERLMKRRLFDTLVFGRGFRLRVVCFEEKIDQSLMVKKPKKLKWPPSLSDVFSSSINNCLPKVLKNADVHHLHFFMVPLTDDLLSTISSCLLHAGSRVHTISISQTSMAYVTSSMLLRFLREVAPKAVDLYRIKCFHENLSAEVFRFIVTRQHFSVDGFGPDPSPIDDDISPN
ncbi:F-box domain protein, partial [Ostertagia ostertagi]